MFGILKKIKLKLTGYQDIENYRIQLPSLLWVSGLYG